MSCRKSSFLLEEEEYLASVKTCAAAVHIDSHHREGPHQWRVLLGLAGLLQEETPAAGPISNPDTLS